MRVRHVHVVRIVYMAVRSVSSFLPFKVANTVQCTKYLFSDSFADLKSSNTYIKTSTKNTFFFEYEKSKFCFKLHFLLRTDEAAAGGWVGTPAQCS